MTRRIIHCVALIALVGCGPKPNPFNPATEPHKSKPSVAVPTFQPAATARYVVTLTPPAAEEVFTAQRQDPSLKYLRVSVGDRSEWKLDLDPNRNADDESGESRGVTVLIDSSSAAKLPPRLVVDYVDNAEQKGFKVTAEKGANVLTAATLPEARKGFQTKLARQERADEPVEQPPPELFGVVKYKSPAGDMAAYLTPDPKDGKKHPAIVWITGGDCNTIGDVWSDGPATNDQTASAYRKAGLVMMFPSLRGGNKNPGVKESFLGEVDDVLAATEFLRKQPYVDPDRIYLGGHSTGGTMALLVAASSDKYRAVFSFGPIADVGGYGPQYVTCELGSPTELEIRSPGRWVNTIKIPTSVFEGTVGGNIDALREMSKASTNLNVRYLPVKGANHFNLLAPVNKLIAERILKDTGAKSNLSFTEDELGDLLKKK